MQFQRPQEGPQTGDGKSSGRCTKRAAVKAAAVTGSGRRRNRRTSPRYGGYEEDAATAGSGRRLKRRALQEAGGGRDGDRYTNIALRQEALKGRVFCRRRAVRVAMTRYLLLPARDSEVPSGVNCKCFLALQCAV
jgi:hypothetical protein